MKFTISSFVFCFVVTDSSVKSFEPKKFRNKRRLQQTSQSNLFLHSSSHQKPQTMAQNGNVDHVRNLDHIPLEVIQMSAGSHHTCAVLEDRSTKCWGSNRFGQLGVGDAIGTGDTIVSSPAEVPTVDLGMLKVKQVAAGGLHTCALAEDTEQITSVWCWGSNNDGQVNGVPGGFGSIIISPVEVQLPGNSPIKDITVGDVHNCAIMQDNSFHCWGYDGDNGYLGASYSNLSIKQIAAGFSHTCAILQENNSVKCWGSNEYYQLGDNALTYLNAKQVVAGADHSCALLFDSTVHCWGYDLYGQLGIQSSGGKYESPQIVSYLRSVESISAGVFHTCAINSGTPFCWGDNRNGQLGIGSSDSSRAVPSAVLFSGDIDIKEFGPSHGGVSCALFTNNLAKCWGDNRNGQLGIGSSGSNIGDDEGEMGTLSFIDFGFNPVHIDSVVPTTVNSWFIARVETKESVKAVLSDDEQPEIEVAYIIVKDKANNNYLKVTTYKEDCSTSAGTLITFIEDTNPTTIDVTSENMNYVAMFDIDLANIISDTGGIWTEPTETDPRGYIKFCVKAELVINKGQGVEEESVSFVETKITIPTLLSSEFAITSFGVATVEDDDVTQEATVNYPVSAFKCDDDDASNDSAVPKNSDIRICIVPNSNEVKVVDILSLSLFQGEAEPKRTPIVNGILDALTDDEMYGIGSNGNGASVKTRITTSFYDDTSIGITGTGTVQIEFMNSGQRRRQLVVFSAMNKDLRGLQDNAQSESSFTLNIPLVTDANAEDSSAFGAIGSIVVALFGTAVTTTMFLLLV